MKTLSKVNVQKVQVETMNVGRIVGIAPAAPQTNVKLLRNRITRLEQAVRRIQAAVKNTTARVNRLEEGVEGTRQLAIQTEHVVQSLLAQLANVEQAVAPLQQSVAQLQQGQASIQQTLAALERSVSFIQTELETGLIANPQMQATLTALEGQSVTLSTPGGSVTGTVTLVGTDAVELREANGDIVIIPFSKITTVS